MIGIITVERRKKNISTKMVEIIIIEMWKNISAEECIRNDMLINLNKRSLRERLP